MTERVSRIEGTAALRPKHLEPSRAVGTDGKDFKQLLMESLQQVNRLQQEANTKVEQLLTGQSDNVVEVFSAVRKADIAFSLLMEIRNKMVEAYQEIQQMRL